MSAITVEGVGVERLEDDNNNSNDKNNCYYHNNNDSNNYNNNDNTTLISNAPSDRSYSLGIYIVDLMVDWSFSMSFTPVLPNCVHVMVSPIFILPEYIFWYHLQCI